ncbi:unnamed protein product [Ixodes hexagonus]
MQSPAPVLLPVAAPTPGTPHHPRKLCWNGVEFTPLEDTRQITFVDISDISSPGEPSPLPDTSSIAATGARQTPVQRLSFSAEARDSSSRDLLGETFWVEKPRHDTQPATGRCTRDCGPTSKDPNSTFSLVSFGKEDDSAATEDVGQDLPAPVHCGSWRTFFGEHGDATAAAVEAAKASCMDVSDPSLLGTLNSTVLLAPRFAAMVEEPSEVPVPPEDYGWSSFEPPPPALGTSFTVPPEAPTTVGAPGHGNKSEAMGDVTELASAATLDGTFSMPSTVETVSAQLSQTEAHEELDTVRDISKETDLQGTFSMPGSGVEGAAERPAAKVHQDNFDKETDHEGTFSMAETAAEAAAECYAVEAQVAKETDQEAERGSSFTVPAASAVEELEQSGPARVGCGYCIVLASSNTGYLAIQLSLLLIPLTTAAVASWKTMSDPRTLAPIAIICQTRPEQHHQLFEDVGIAAVGDLAALEATFGEPPEASGIAAGHPVAESKTAATSARPAVPLGRQRSLPAPRVSTKLQPGKSRPAGAIKRSTAIPGRQLPTGGSTKVASRGLQRPSVAVPSQRPLRPLQQTLASRQGQAPSAHAPAAGGAETSAPSTGTATVQASRVHVKAQAHPVGTQRLAFKPSIPPPASLRPRTAAVPKQSRLAPVRATGTAASRQSQLPAPPHGQRAPARPQLGSAPASSSAVRASTPVG